MTTIYFKDYRSCLNAMMYCYNNNIDIEPGTVSSYFLNFANERDAVMISLRFS